jgi:hypothetical protein
MICALSRVPAVHTTDEHGFTRKKASPVHG